MQRHHCVAVLQWEAGQGGSASQFSLLSSVSSLLGGEVGHLALAAFIFDTNKTNANIDELIQAALSNAIEQKSLMTAPFPIGDTGIQSASYLSFWGTKKSFCGGNGEMHIAITSDYAALLERKPEAVKYEKITPLSYQLVNDKILQLHTSYGNWRPTRNCSTLVSEALALAISLENNQPLLRNATAFESLIDTPTAIVDRFPGPLMIEYAQPPINNSVN